MDGFNTSQIKGARRSDSDSDYFTGQSNNLLPGAVTGGHKSLALTREMNLDTLSSDSEKMQC